MKAFAYYDSCMDTNTINARDFQPIKTLLQQYNLWVDDYWDMDQTWTLEDALIKLLEDLGTKSLFELNVELGMTNNSFYFISVSTVSLSFTAFMYTCLLSPSLPFYLPTYLYFYLHHFYRSSCGEIIDCSLQTTA